jgi:hypothetical protein
MSKKKISKELRRADKLTMATTIVHRTLLKQTTNKQQQQQKTQNLKILLFQNQSLSHPSSGCKRAVSADIIAGSHQVLKTRQWFGSI